MHEAPKWQDYTDATGDKFWTLEYLGHYAAVTRLGQAWYGRVWPQDDDDQPWFSDCRDHPSKVMAMTVLAIEATVRAES